MSVCVCLKSEVTLRGFLQQLPSNSNFILDLGPVCDACASAPGGGLVWGWHCGWHCFRKVLPPVQLGLLSEEVGFGVREP